MPLRRSAVEPPEGGALIARGLESIEQQLAVKRLGVGHPGLGRDAQGLRAIVAAGREQRGELCRVHRLQGGDIEHCAHTAQYRTLSVAKAERPGAIVA